jgi:hypothetical protein
MSTAIFCENGSDGVRRVETGWVRTKRTFVLPAETGVPERGLQAAESNPGGGYLTARPLCAGAEARR